jgi:hypothetical protein
MRNIRRRLALAAGGLALVAGTVTAGSPALAATAAGSTTARPAVWTQVGTYDTEDDCVYDGGTGVHRGEWKNYHCYDALKWELWVLY